MDLCANPVDPCREIFPFYGRSDAVDPKDETEDLFSIGMTLVVTVTTHPCLRPDRVDSPRGNTAEQTFGNFPLETDLLAY
jgi:hypothetical protein